MSKPQERITASRITPGVVIAVEKRGDYLVTTRRVRGVIHATVTDKAVATLPGSGKRGYAITTDHGAVEPCQGIQTFQLINAPTVPAGAPDASAVVVAGTVVAMVERFDLVATAPAPAVVTCTDPYDHRPGVMGCPVTVKDCNGIPTELTGSITERPIVSPAATGMDEIGAEIAGHLRYRFTVGDVTAGYNDPGRNRGVREVSTWSTSADGHAVTVVRYTGRETDLSTMKDYVSVQVDGVHVGTARTVEPADIARVARDHIMDLPAPVVAESAPAVDQVDAPTVPAVGDLTDRSHVGPWLVLAIPHGADPSPIVGQENPHWLTQGKHDSRAVATRQAVTLAASGQWGGVRVTRHHQGNTVAEWYASNTTGWSEWGALTDRGWIERAQDEIDGREFTYGEFVDPYGREWYGGSADECARWMAERGVTMWTRAAGDPRPVCPVDRCADAAGHPYPGMHRDHYGRGFLVTLPTDDGDQGDGGNGGTPTDVDPIGPAPAGERGFFDQGGRWVPQGNRRPAFSTWEELAEWIGDGRPVVVDAAPVSSATASFTCPAHGAVPVPVDIDGGDARRIVQEHQQCTDGDPFGMAAIERESTPAAQFARTLRAAGWSAEEIAAANAKIEAPAPAGDVRPLYTVTNNGHGRVRVHAIGCRDIGRDVRREGVMVGDHWDVRADHVRDIVIDLYDDATADNWREFLDLEVMPCADLDESDDAPAVAEDTAPARTMEQIRAEISAKLEAERASLLNQAESAGAEMHADGMPCAPESSGWFARISSVVSVDSAEEMRPRLRDAFVRGYQTAADRAAEQAPTVRPGQVATIRGWSGASVFVTAVTDGHVIGIESGGSCARVALDMVTAVEDLTPDATAATARGYLAERRQADDVRPGLEALAGTAPADLGDSAALIEEGPEDAPYHVVHTKEGGTEVHGSSRGDGVWEVLRKWGQPRSFGGALYLRNTRNRLAVPSRIRSIGAEIAEATGCTVRIVVDNRAADVLAREADRMERVDARVEMLDERSTRRRVEAHNLRERAEKLTEGIPMGQPVLRDHYSGPGHQRTLDRSDAARRKGWDAGDRAAHAESRAAGAADNEAAKHEPRAMTRRRERLQEDERGLLRRYNGEPHPDTINGQRLAELREEIAIITERLDKMAANGEFVAWTRDDFRPGDEVNVGGHWHRVIRANPKTVTVPWWASKTPDTDKKGDNAPYDKVHGRRRDGWQIDTPTGAPWPVSDAKRVARWVSLTAEANRPHSEEPARQRRVWVQIAERIGYGLDLRNATYSEVEAYRTKDERLRTVAGRRAWYLQLVEIFDRLSAGENPDTVAADVQAADVEPAWTMPTGTPVDVRVDQLRRGDIIAGMWDTRGFGDPKALVRYFSGPVAFVSKIENRRERGDWVTVRLVDGSEREFKSHVWFAAYPQGRPTVKVADLVAGQRADIRGRDQFGKPSRCWGYVTEPSEFREGKRNRAGEITGHPMLGVTVSETPSGLGGIVMQMFTERDAWCAVLDDREPAQLPAVALADEAGEAAYRAGRTRAPGIDVTVRDLIAGLPVGSGSATIMEAFTRGYDRAAGEAARLVLAGADQ